MRTAEIKSTQGTPAIDALGVGLGAIAVVLMLTGLICFSATLSAIGGSIFLIAAVGFLVRFSLLKVKLRRLNLRREALAEEIRLLSEQD